MVFPVTFHTCLQEDVWSQAETFVRIGLGRKLNSWRFPSTGLGLFGFDLAFFFLSSHEQHFFPYSIHSTSVLKKIASASS